MVSAGTDVADSRRHSLPFLKPKYPPPPAPLSLDDAEMTPEINASFFSLLYWNWVSPMMALGAARPLEATDMWKLDEKRSAGKQGAELADHYADRKKAADEYNTRLADPSTPLPLLQRLTFPLLPHRQKREHDYRTKNGQRKPSLAMALSDTFGTTFWIAACYKLFADVGTACSPLLIRALIKWSQRYELSQKGIGSKPGYGEGAGYALGLLFLLLASSMGLHHYFARTMAVGVLSRSALISAVYERSLRLTQKARGHLPNGKVGVYMLALTADHEPHWN